MNSGRAILIYGPAGSGSTFLAEHLASLQPGKIPVPYAITVGGEIIQIFDPLIHEPRHQPRPAAAWYGPTMTSAVLRPVVIAGGELTLPMLDLQFDPTTCYYQAPPLCQSQWRGLRRTTPDVSSLPRASSAKSDRAARSQP
ncbi:MAG: hypothetical protein R3E45_07170 [Rhodocyclaceae bacterium]